MDASQHAQTKAVGSPDYFFSRVARCSTKSILTFAFEDRGVWDKPRMTSWKRHNFPERHCPFVSFSLPVTSKQRTLQST